MFRRCSANDMALILPRRPMSSTSCSTTTNTSPLARSKAAFYTFPATHQIYVIGENVFTGDSLFEPDVGSARCDFPGGSANQLYRSISTLLSLPPHYHLYTGHDYPPPERDSGKADKGHTTVAEQSANNKHVKSGTAEETFVKWRRERDSTLPEPRLIHQSLQINIRAGRLPKVGPDGFRFLQVPLKVSEPWC